MTTLITGGTGFLGRHLIDQLIATGERNLRVFGRTIDPELVAMGVDFVEGSLLDKDDVIRAVEGVTRVYHLAGRVERDRRKAHVMYSLHVDGCAILYEALRSNGETIEKVVVASTSGTVGVSKDAEFIATDTSSFAESVVKNWPYYLSKIYAERVGNDFFKRYDLPIVHMRPTLLLGPGDWRESSTGDVVLFLKGKVPGLIEGGMSFVDVRDAAEAFRQAMEKGRAGETYLLGAINLTLADFFEHLAALTGLAAPKMPIPGALLGLGSKLLGALSQVKDDIGDLNPVSIEMARHYWYIDSLKAKRELGWTPRDPVLTLRDTVAWIKAHHPDFAGAQDERREAPPAEFVRAETVEYARQLREKASGANSLK